MFRKKDKITVIGAGAVIEGTVRIQGHIVIDGVIDGSIEADGELAIGPKGHVLGEVTAGRVVVGGRVEGRVTARTQLRVLATGLVQGDVFYEALQVERGGVIAGHTHQTSVQHEHFLPAIASTSSLSLPKVESLPPARPSTISVPHLKAESPSIPDADTKPITLSPIAPKSIPPKPPGVKPTSLAPLASSATATGTLPVPDAAQSGV